MRHRTILSWAMTFVFIFMITPITFAFDYTTVDFPHADNTLISDTNARGEIVGYYYNANDNPHGFLLYKGVFTPIDAPDASLTIPYGINDYGQIVGYYQDADGNAQGFLLYKGVFTPIDAPGANLTIPYGINNRGQIWGYYWEGSNVHGFLTAPPSLHQ